MDLVVGFDEQGNPVPAVAGASDAPDMAHRIEEGAYQIWQEQQEQLRASFAAQRHDSGIELKPAKSEHQLRKERPVARGVLDYFPDALMAVAELSRVGNEQHNAGQPMHWAKGKSTDHADCILRHLIDRGTLDSDGVSHSVKVAWRALALLQSELEAADADLRALRDAQQAKRLAAGSGR